MTYNIGVLSPNEAPKRPVVNRRLWRGNKRATSTVSVGKSRLPSQARKLEPSNEIYRVSLVANPTRQQQKVFDTYRKEINRSGWSLIPTEPSGKEKVAYIAALQGSVAESAAAEALVNSTVAEMIRGTAV
jgi:hypothetical protein